MRRFLCAVAALLLCLAAPAAAQLAERPRDVPAPPDLSPRIGALVRPLAHAPSIQTAGEGLVVELDAGTAPGPHPASLLPSFGQVRPVVDLGEPRAVAADATSTLWPGRVVHRLTYDLPGDLAPDLYDVRVDVAGTTDVQRRALRVVETIPAKPRVAILADPSVGDPRPIQEGVTEALPPGLPYPPETAGDPSRLPANTLGTTGNPAEGEGRWAAFERAVAEINLAKPDFVLIAGDLTFAAHPRALPYEYEDAWRLLDALEVPSFASPGNHDLYAVDYDRYQDGSPTAERPFTADGRVEWQRYFGPLHYSVDIGDAFHLVGLNTFDYHDVRPFPPPEFDTLAGGYVGPAQLDWLVADLDAFRRRSPRGALVTFAHHDPSWLVRRHPWPDRGNRDTVRELLAGADVWAHFAGHTHEDRVARYYRTKGGQAVGSIVETNGRQHLADDYPLTYLHDLDATAGDLDPFFAQPDWSEPARAADLAAHQQRLTDILSDPRHGPLFVTTTSAGSGLIGEDWGLGGYWGWRLADLRPAPGGGYTPDVMGYATAAEPADVRAFLDATAARPQRWNAAHAALGVLSLPSGFVEAAVDGASAELRNDLLEPFTAQVRLALATDRPQDITASGGKVVAVRAGQGMADVWVVVRLDPGERATVVVHH